MKPEEGKEGKSLGIRRTRGWKPIEGTDHGGGGKPLGGIAVSSREGNVFEERKPEDNRQKVPEKEKEEGEETAKEFSSRHVHLLTQIRKWRNLEKTLQGRIDSGETPKTKETMNSLNAVRGQRTRLEKAYTKNYGEVPEDWINPGH